MTKPLEDKQEPEPFLYEELYEERPMQKPGAAEEEPEMSPEEHLELNPKFGVVLWRHNFNNIADAIHELDDKRGFPAIQKWNEALAGLYSIADSLDCHFDLVEKKGWTRKKQQALKDLICAIPYVDNSKNDEQNL